MFQQSMGCCGVLGCIKCTEFKNVSNLFMDINTTENSRIFSSIYAFGVFCGVGFVYFMKTPDSSINKLVNDLNNAPKINSRPTRHPLARIRRAHLSMRFRHRQIDK